jgi:hypothetical protein
VGGVPEITGGLFAAAAVAALTTQPSAIRVDTRIALA